MCDAMTTTADTRFPVAAVMFDLDGTLMDTAADLAEAANAMLAELHRPLRETDEIRLFLGRGIQDLVMRCLGADAEEEAGLIERAVASFRRHYAAVNGIHSEVYPGVVEALDRLSRRGIRLACVTNKATVFTEPLLVRKGLAGYFQAVVCGDTLPVKKPDPGMLWHACWLLGVMPAQSLMIGDSANDASAARAAGMPVLLLPYGYSEGVPVDMIESDGLISSATEILDRIRAI